MASKKYKVVTLAQATTSYSSNSHVKLYREHEQKANKNCIGSPAIDMAALIILRLQLGLYSLGQRQDAWNIIDALLRSYAGGVQ